MAYPYIADRDAVIAQDATQNAYSVTVPVVTGKRYAIGVALLKTSEGNQFVVKVNGTQVAARTPDTENLAIVTSDWFEDGVVWEATSTTDVVITVETATPDSFAIDGVIVREPADRSGIVEDQGSGTHCYPISAMYDDKRYHLHAEMYTGSIHLSIDSVPKGEVFPAIALDYNERYHNSVFVVPQPNGVVIGRTGHNQPNLDVRYLTLGSADSMSSIVNLATGGTKITYCRAVRLQNDDIVMVTRGSLSSDVNQTTITAVTLQDAHLLGSSGHTVIEDVITGGNSSIYPVAVEVVNGEAGADMVAVFMQTRFNESWARTLCAIYAPHVGANGRWYSTAGHSSDVLDSLGTPASPRFSNTQRDQSVLTGDGIVVFGQDATLNRYMLQSAFVRVTQWPTTETAATADISWPFVDGLGDIPDYGAVTYRWAMIVDNVRTNAPDDFTSPAGLSSNSYRQFGVCFEDASNVKRFIVTDRGTRLHENLYGETTENYYDWGSAKRIAVFTVTNEFDPNTISFDPVGFHDLNTPLTAGWMTRIQGTDTVIYEQALNELHPTHRQGDTSAALGTIEDPDAGNGEEPGEGEFTGTIFVVQFARDTSSRVIGVVYRNSVNVNGELSNVTLTIRDGAGNVVMTGTPTVANNIFRLTAESSVLQTSRRYSAHIAFDYQSTTYTKDALVF